MFTKTVELGDGINLDMIFIPGGRFVMGSPENEVGRWPDEGPPHEVTLTPFFMGKYPVTQKQYLAITGYNPSHFTGKKRPVECVTWIDAINFCRHLSDKIGVKFSLPSEGQWEYACRAGTTTPFYFGDTITSTLANCDGRKIYGNGPKGDYRGQTTDVGIFPPNEFGLYDMHGNVWEWCADDWHLYSNGAPTDGSVWLNGDTNIRRLRGGSWLSYPSGCRSAVRNGYDFDGANNDHVGFRIVSVPPRTLKEPLCPSWPL